MCFVPRSSDLILVCKESHFQVSGWKQEWNEIFISVNKMNLNLNLNVIPQTG